MIPASPVSLRYRDGAKLEVVFARDQPEYTPLPVLVSFDQHRVTIRWRLTWRERLRVLLTGNLWHQVLVFGAPLQPVKITTEEPLPKDLV